MKEPLVSIVIPTFNRADRIARSIESVLGQSFGDFELVVFDNASTDYTRELVAKYIERDARVKIVTREKNIGLNPNFNESIRAVSGQYRMWLADDDWLDSNFISEAVAVLESRPTVALVSPTCRIHFHDRPVKLGAIVNVTARQPWRRVLDYYRSVADNSIFYGLYRHDAVTQTKLAENRLTTDWHYLATIAHIGEIVTLENAYLNRSGEGASADLEQFARNAGKSRIFQKLPYFAAAIECFNDVSSENPHFASYAKPNRVALALGVFAIVVFRKVIAIGIYRVIQKLFWRR